MRRLSLCITYLFIEVSSETGLLNVEAVYLKENIHHGYFFFTPSFTCEVSSLLGKGWSFDGLWRRVLLLELL